MLSKAFFSSLLLVLIAGFSYAKDNDTTIEDYSPTIQKFKDSPAAAEFFSSAYGYAVFPTVGKGGFGIGGAHGKGQVYQGGKVTGIATMNQLSVGFQVGAQAFSQIIFFQDRRAYDDFVSGNFEFDATASAVAITSGVQATASTGSGSTAGASAGPNSGTQAKNKYSKGMATFIQAKGGLMYEASIGGQKFKFTPL